MKIYSVSSQPWFIRNNLKIKNIVLGREANVSVFYLKRAQIDNHTEFLKVSGSFCKLRKQPLGAQERNIKINNPFDREQCKKAKKQPYPLLKASH